MSEANSSVASSERSEQLSTKCEQILNSMGQGNNV